jgi:lipid-A-disaccharide synthase
MIAGYELVRRERASIDARVLLAASLDPATRTFAIARCLAAGIEYCDVDPREGIAPLLPAFEASLCASGTASLECALARSAPVVCYRVGAVTELAARALLRTPHVALPNILLKREAFPELLQRTLTPARIAEELARILDDLPAFAACSAELERMLESRTQPSSEVASFLLPWLHAPLSASHRFSP